MTFCYTTERLTLPEVSLAHEISQRPPTKYQQSLAPQIKSYYFVLKWYIVLYSNNPSRMEVTNKLTASLAKASIKHATVPGTSKLGLRWR